MGNASGWRLYDNIMVSLTGLPPTAGFIGKFYIFAALIKGGNSFIG